MKKTTAIKVAAALKILSMLGGAQEIQAQPNCNGTRVIPTANVVGLKTNGVFMQGETGTSTFAVEKNGVWHLAKFGHRAFDIQDSDIANTTVHLATFDGWQRWLGTDNCPPRHRFYSIANSSVNPNSLKGRLTGNTDAAAISVLDQRPNSPFPEMPIVDLQVGRATILATTDPRIGARAYNAEIIRIQDDGSAVLRITDRNWPRHLGITVANGHSGSPVIQNGGMGGAVAAMILCQCDDIGNVIIRPAREIMNALTEQVTR